jgi:hypothetical protein
MGSEVECRGKGGAVGGTHPAEQPDKGVREPMKHLDYIGQPFGACLTGAVCPNARKGQKGAGNTATPAPFPDFSGKTTKPEPFFSRESCPTAFCLRRMQKTLLISGYLGNIFYSILESALRRLDRLLPLAVQYPYNFQGGV